MADTYIDPMAGQQTGAESSLSSWAGPYVTEMLGRGRALASMPYQAYTGPLTAAPSALQNQAFSGLASLTMPTAAQTSYTPQSFTGAAYAAPTAAQLAAGQPGTYTPASGNVVQQYMSPYLMAALEPQMAEARRQADISRVQQAGRLTKAGAYGGGRQAIMESELDRNLLRNLTDITGRGYQDAFTAAQNQFNTEEARRMAATGQAQQYGLQALQQQLGAGATQRGITGEGIAADIGQFEQERDYPYKQVQYMQSLLQGLPLATQSYSYQEPSGLSQLLGGAGGILGLLQQLNLLGGDNKSGGLTKNAGTPGAGQPK